MKILKQCSAVGFTALLFAVSAASNQEPLVRATVVPKGKAAAAIVVEASDPEGLDSLEITSQQADSTYQMQLSRSTIEKTFRRTYTLPELFPMFDDWKSPVQLKVIVRNTRRAVSSVTIQVQPITKP